MTTHARSLIALLKQKLGNPKLGAEVGVWRGHLSAALLGAFPELILWMVDPWETGGSHETMPKSIAEMRAAYREAMDLTAFASERRRVRTMTSEQATILLADRLLDFAFIDAEHTYECVRQDCGLWFPKVREGGLLCGHDYDGKGDRSGKFGVKRAVDEFVAVVGREVHVERGLIWWIEK